MFIVIIVLFEKECLAVQILHHIEILNQRESSVKITESCVRYYFFIRTVDYSKLTLVFGVYIYMSLFHQSAIDKCASYCVKLFFISNQLMNITFFDFRIRTIEI